MCGFLENCCDKKGLSPIQYEKSSFQNYQFGQRTSKLKCKFVIGTRMNTRLCNGLNTLLEKLKDLFLSSRTPGEILVLGDLNWGMEKTFRSNVEFSVKSNHN